MKRRSREPIFENIVLIVYLLYSRLHNYTREMRGLGAGGFTSYIRVELTPIHSLIKIFVFEKSNRKLKDITQIQA